MLAFLASIYQEYCIISAGHACLKSPLEKGDLGLLVFEPPFFKGGQGGFVFSWFGQVIDPHVPPATPHYYLYDGNSV
jgi:hypothetical protein